MSLYSRKLVVIPVTVALSLLAFAGWSGKTATKRNGWT